MDYVIVMLGRRKNPGIGKRESGREMTSGVGIGSREFRIKKFWRLWRQKFRFFCAAGKNFENFGGQEAMLAC